jgi:hypothetical protein
MAAAPKTVFKNPKAVEVCDQIRLLYNIHPVDGWIAAPHHTRKHIQIGNRRAGHDPVIADEVETLAFAVRRLGLAEPIGYTLVVVSR